MYYTKKDWLIGYVYIGIGLLLIIIGAAELILKIAFLVTGLWLLYKGLRMCKFIPDWMHFIRWRI